jgi:hypothetical protein
MISDLFLRCPQLSKCTPIVKLMIDDFKLFLKPLNAD